MEWVPWWEDNDECKPSSLSVQEVTELESEDSNLWHFLKYTENQNDDSEEVTKDDDQLEEVLDLS